MSIGGPFFEFTRISVAENLTIPLRDQIWLLFLDMRYSHLKFRYVWEVQFKSDGGILHIRSVDCQQCFSIIYYSI